MVEVGHRKYDLGEDVIKALRESADVLVLIGFNRLLKGHVLDACKHGVLSTHPSNTFEKRGRPDTFFEWINENKTLTYSLQRLNNSVDGGEVITQEKVDISSAKSLSEAKYLVRTVRPKLYVPGLTKLENGEKSFPVPGSESELTRSRDRDRIENIVKYLLVSLKRRYR